MGRPWTRGLFLVLLPVLFAQMAVCFRWREMFPAIMMPRFGHQQPGAGTAHWTQVVISAHFADGGSVELDKQALFAEVHLPQRDKILQRVFGWSDEGAVDAGVRRWLEQRTREITGRRAARRVEFAWYELTSRLAEPDIEPRISPLGVRVVEF